MFSSNGYIGDTKHKLEANGKKWTATSTLTVLAYGPNSTASCIVRHQALREEKLMASFRFEDLPRIGTAGSFSSGYPILSLCGGESYADTHAKLKPINLLLNESYVGQKKNSKLRFGGFFLLLNYLKIH